MVPESLLKAKLQSRSFNVCDLEFSVLFRPFVSVLQDNLLSLLMLLGKLTIGNLSPAPVGAYPHLFLFVLKVSSVISPYIAFDL